MAHRNGFAFRSLLAAMTLLSFVAAHRACAAVLTVTDGGDDPNAPLQGSLRRLLSECGPGDEIRFAAGASVVTLAGAISIRSGANVTIAGPARIAQGSSSGDRIFTVESGATCAMRDLTLTGGRSAGNGGAVVTAGKLTMERCALQENQAACNGGALSVEGSRSVTTLTDCAVTNNSVSGNGYSGGGVYIEAGSVTMTNCNVKDNANAFSGGGLFNMGTTTLTDCVVESNDTAASGFGGGIYHAGSSVMTLSGCAVRNNSSGRLGGGICTVGSSTALVLKNRCEINGNTPDNIYGSFTSSGANFIGSSPNRSATAFSGYSGETEPEPRSIAGDEDVARVTRDLADSGSALHGALAAALSADLGRTPAGTGATLHYANTFENVAIASADLVVEYTASWPENVRYYSLFRRADDGGYEAPDRGVRFEIRAGQTLPDGVTPPDFYEEGEGLMTWRNVVTDGGSYDLNPAVGVVTFRVCSVRVAEAAGDAGSGGGCAVAPGFAPLALLLIVPLLLARKRSRPIV